MYNLKYEHQNKDENDDHGESYYKNENDDDTKQNEHPHFTNLENSCDDEDDSSHDNALKNEYEDFNYELKNDICNRENQWYAFLYYNILYWLLEITLDTIYCIVVTCLRAVSRKALNL